MRCETHFSVDTAAKYWVGIPEFAQSFASSEPENGV
jgi:hypothetical protein